MADELPDDRVEALMQGLAKAKVRLDCPSCGHNVWRPMQWLVKIPFAVPHGPRGVAALGLACERCGYVRFHVAQALDQYIDPRGH